MRYIVFCLILLLTTPCFAEDYWVFIRTYNRSGVTAEDDAGRSKEGDVVLAYPVIPGEVPTKKEQEEYLILKTDLTKPEAEELTQAWVDEKEVPIAYRRKKFGYKTFSNKKKGLETTKINATLFKNQIKQKTTLDLISYNFSRSLYLTKLPFILFDKKVVRPAHAASDHKICAVGANCSDEDYNTLTAWEDANDGVLSGVIQASVYDDDGDIVDNLVVNGSTVGASDYMLVTAPSAERHDGTFGSGATVRVSTVGTDLIQVIDDYFRVTYMELDNKTGEGDTIELGEDNAKVGYCLLDGGRRGVHFINDKAGNTIYNTFIHNAITEGVDSTASGDGTLYNVTIAASHVTNVYAANAPTTVTNTYAFGAQSGSDFSEANVDDLTITYSASDDSTADNYGGSGNVVDKEPYDELSNFPRGASMDSEGLGGADGGGFTLTLDANVVQEWVSDSTTNQGVCMYARVVSGDNEGHSLYSSEYATVADRPKLTVVTDVTTHTFQEGTDSYAGTIDSYVDDTNGDTNYQNATTIRILGKNSPDSEHMTGYLEFDISDIPSGETVSSAKIDFVIEDEEASESSDYIDVVPRWCDWAEGTITWNNQNDGCGAVLLDGTLDGAGTDDPGSGLYSDDITQTARTSTWDIGADEYIAAAAAAFVDVITNLF